jgi:hypothetical protein
MPKARRGKRAANSSIRLEEYACRELLFVVVKSAHMEAAQGVRARGWLGAAVWIAAESAPRFLPSSLCNIASRVCNRGLPMVLWDCHSLNVGREPVS